MDKRTAIETLVHAAYEKGGFNWAWFYAENGEIVSKGGLGYRDPDDELAITDDTIFQLASITKQFTATACLVSALGLNASLTQTGYLFI